MLKCSKNGSSLHRFCLAIASAAALQSCGGNAAPLDADTRIRIDSTVTAQINAARIELDSICAYNEKAQMTLMVDSIRKVRLREIEAQLKLVPR